MITEYENGQALLDENEEFLQRNPYLAAFFYWDAPLVTHSDRINYALKISQGEYRLLAVKAEPYSLLLFGDSECVPELAAGLFANGYEIKSYLCAEDIGNRMARVLWVNYGIRYKESLAMDFMEAREQTKPSSPDVEIPGADDVDEICECMERFVIDCGLQDKVDREKTANTIKDFRVLRRDGKIVSLAKLAPSTDRDLKITNVYTRDEYRGKGYGSTVVNAVKNEILSEGRYATLNVDKKNPISNHIYYALGFRRLFSQGEYRRI